jgi:DNA-binding HxlR family transcriptional regulator
MTDRHKSQIYQNAYYPRLILNLVASKWTLLVLHAVQRDTKRYSAINRDVDGITQKMLTETLRKLERDGIVKRMVHPIFPPKVEYKLTPLGLELLGVTETIAQWAEDHFDEVKQARHLYDSKPVVEN